MVRVIVGLHVESVNDHHKEERYCHAEDIVQLCTAICRTEGIVDSEDKVDTETKIEHQRDQLEEIVEDLVRLTLSVSHAFLLIIRAHVFEQGPPEDPVGARIADDENWVHDLHKGVIGHGSLCDANPGNHFAIPKCVLPFILNIAF